MTLKRIKELLTKHNLDFALFANSSLENKELNIQYLTGLDLENVMVLVSQKKEFIFVPELEMEKSKRTKFKAIKMEKKYFNQLSLFLSKSSGKKLRIGINFKTTTLSFFKKLKNECSNHSFVDISQPLEIFRREKTPEELDLIKKACSIGDEIFAELVGCLKKKKFGSELGIANFLKTQIINRGLETAFSPVVSSGRNASQPHAEPSEELNKGFLIIDFGVKYKGYCSDMTRTLYMGHPSKKEREIYSNLLYAQSAAINHVAVQKPGKKLIEIDSFCREKLGKYRRLFIHGLGHGVGLSVHEKPVLNTTTTDSLQEGDIFTIEPGIYLKKNYGIRIEDLLYYTSKGISILTKSPKELIIIN